MGCCGGKESMASNTTPPVKKADTLRQGENRNRKDYPVNEKRAATIGKPVRLTPSASPTARTMGTTEPSPTPSPILPSISQSPDITATEDDPLADSKKSRQSNYSTDSEGHLANIPSIRIQTARSEQGTTDENPLAGGTFSADTPVDSNVKKDANIQISAAYDLVDQEKYDAAFDKFRDLLDQQTQQSMDYVVVSLGLAVLHNLGGGEWSRPQSVNDATPQQLEHTESWLSERLKENPNSACALLACCEYQHALGRKDAEANYRLAASKTSHPLGILRYTVSLLSKLRSDRDAKTIPSDQYEIEKKEIIRTFVRISIPNTRVAARAGKLIWVSYYKGTDGITRDLNRAAELLEKAIKYEQGNLQELQGHLMRVKEKQQAESRPVSGVPPSGKKRILSSTPRNMFDTMRSPSPGEGGRRRAPSPSVVSRESKPPLPLGRSLDMGRLDSSRKPSRSVSPSGLQRNSSVCSHTTETHVEVEINGTTFGVIKNNSLPVIDRQNSARRKKKTVSSHDTDLLDDPYDDNGSELASSIVYSGGSDRSRAERRTGRLGSARGDSISSRLRSESHLSTDQQNRYRTHSRAQSSPSAY